MLFDDEEIRIMSTAGQPNLREPARNDVVFTRIFDDFFAARRFDGTRILELGPGHYDFGRLITAAGATVVAMDHDPAVIALGQKRGHTVIFSDFRDFDWPSLKGAFDGLFSRATITPAWFQDPQSYGVFIDTICSVLKPDGWGWFAPFHAGTLSGFPPARVERLLAAERHAFERNGFRGFDEERIARRYGIAGPPLLYMRNLELPGHMARILQRAVR